MDDFIEILIEAIDKGDWATALSICGVVAILAFWAWWFGFLPQGFPFN